MKQLTPREKQIARLISSSYTDDAIAKELSMSVRTVKGHNNRIYQKFGVKSRIELAVILKAPLNSPFRKLIEDKNIGEL